VTRGVPRPGLLAWALFLALGGCLRDPPPPTDPALAEALGLDPSTPIHRFDMVDREGRIGLFPGDHEIRPGSVVQFVTRDRRVYSVHFEVDSVSLPARAFLEETAQESSPPLVEAGARFVVTFAGAPEGAYPFRIEGHGAVARGRIVVAPR
jgi:plastocyanin